MLCRLAHTWLWKCDEPGAVGKIYTKAIGPVEFHGTLSPEFYFNLRWTGC